MPDVSCYMSISVTFDTLFIFDFSKLEIGININVFYVLYVGIIKTIFKLVVLSQQLLPELK